MMKSYELLMDYFDVVQTHSFDPLHFTLYNKTIAIGIKP